MEFVIGASAAGCAVVFTNPLEVVKTRYQLQGELQSKGQYKVHYGSIFNTFIQICKNDGVLGLQKGLSPAIAHQILLNGTRLGLYQVLEDNGFVHKTGTENGEKVVSLPKSIMAGIVAGATGAFIGSPLYLIKTHLQSKANAKIAVGHQHDTEGIVKGLLSIYRKHGLVHLWRGAFSAIVRVSVGSAVQYSSFMICKEYFISHKIFTPDQKVLNAFAAGMVGGVGVALVMSPLDLVSTRLYNQGVDEHGKGLLYKSYGDCVVKTFKAEGVSGLYKGVFPCYLRIGPHTVLCLVFWDILKDARKTYLSKVIE